MAANLVRKKRIGSISFAVALCLVGMGSVAHADDRAYMADSAGALGIVDLTTGIYTPISPASGRALSAGLGEANGSLYGGFLNSGILQKVSTSGATAGSLTAVGNGTTNPQFVDGLGSTTSGLYALDFYANLLSVDPITGVATQINLNPTGLSRVVSAYALSSGSSALYYAFNYCLYQLNTATGAPTMLGPLGGGDPADCNPNNKYLGLLTSPLQFFAMVEVGGTLYGVDSIQKIYKVNKSNGLATYWAQIVSPDNHTTPYPSNIWGLAPYFQTCTNLPIMVTGATPVYFSSLQSAFNGVASGVTIDIEGINFTENPNFNGNKAVTLKGGYDCDYVADSSYSKITGTLTISNGTVTVSNLIIH